MDVNTSDPVGLQATVAGIERRVRNLETRAFGEPQPGNTPMTLFFLYTDALIGTLDPSENMANLWNHVVLGIDEETLLELTRTTRDPFSWKPFLFILDHLLTQGFDTEDAAAHLLSVAKSLMKIQGLGRLKPEDVMGWVVDPRSVLSAR